MSHAKEEAPPEPGAWGLGFGRGYGTAQLCYKRQCMCVFGAGVGRVSLSSGSSPQLAFHSRAYKVKNGEAIQV